MEPSEHLARQFAHVVLRTAGVRRDEVGDELVGEPLAAADGVERLVELLEEGEGGLAHQPQHMLLGVLGGHLEPPRGVVAEHRLEVGRIVEEVVADAAADEGLADALHGADFLVEGQQRPVVVVEVGATLRMEARGAPAAGAERPVAAPHAVHVGRGGPDVREVALEAGHADDTLHLGENRPLAARVYELALVGRDGAEGAAAEAAPVDVERELNHLPGRNLPLAAVARVGRPLVGEVERVVELLGRERGVGGCDHHPAVARPLDERRNGLHQVALRLDDGEVLAEGALVGPALLEGVEADGRRGVEPRDVVVVGQEGHLADAAQQLGVVAVVHGACDLLHHPLAHAVDEQVGARLDEHRGAQRVAPVVVVGQPPQRGLDAPHDHRHMGEEALEDARVDRHGVVGAEARAAAGRIGVVVAQPEVGRVVVDHRVHRSGRDAEEEARRTELGEVAQVVLPVGLGDDGDAVALGLEQAADDRGAEGRVVDVGVAREENDVEVIPSAFADLFDGCRQKHGGLFGNG